MQKIRSLKLLKSIIKGGIKNIEGIEQLKGEAYVECSDYWGWFLEGDAETQAQLALFYVYAMQLPGRFSTLHSHHDVWTHHSPETVGPIVKYFLANRPLHRCK